MAKRKDSSSKSLMKTRRESVLKKELRGEKKTQESKDEHYYSENPTSEAIYSKYDIEILGKKYNIITVSGVFGKSRLDPGTRLLINSTGELDTAKVLDLGCGTGVIGLSLKIMNPAIKLTLSDINSRAVSVARKNFLENKLKGKFTVSDGFEKLQGKYDLILLNPPQSAGKKNCERLISEAYDALEAGGKIRLVARHNKGGKSFSDFMEKTYGNVTVITKKGGYRVYESKREK